MMSIIHVTNGDHAAETLREALKLAERDERVIALKDDLAVGQLQGRRRRAGIRAALFWRHVLTREVRLQAELGQQEALLRELVRDDGQIVIWHGQSASDQLALRRVAYHAAQRAAATERSQAL